MRKAFSALFIAFAVIGGLVHIASATSTGTSGTVDLVLLRDTDTQLSGRVAIRDSSGTVTQYYWGGDRCATMPEPTNRKVDMVINAQIAGREVQLDYNDHSSQYGSSHCWNGGVILW